MGTREGMKTRGNKFDRVRRELACLDELAGRNQWICDFLPLPKLAVTIAYVAVLTSFDKYDLCGVAGMAVYPILSFYLAELSAWDAFVRLRVALPLVMAVGVLNPFFDSERVAVLGIQMPAGVISMVVLMTKGILAVLAAYLLIGTTSIEEICAALRSLHLPEIIVVQVMLTYRYLEVFASEVGRVSAAYGLRAPKQRGIHFKSWGTLVGHILLRSRDRARAVYESMVLRGYGAVADGGSKSTQKRQLSGGAKIVGIAYALCWGLIFGIFRAFPVFEMVGKLFTIGLFSS